MRCGAALLGTKHASSRPSENQGRLQFPSGTLVLCFDSVLEPLPHELSQRPPHQSSLLSTKRNRYMLRSSQGGVFCKFDHVTTEDGVPSC